jgi:hypothetical protein
MRIDLYTKTILTLIALLLAVIALKPIVQPQPTIAQGNLSSIQFSGARIGFWAFDTRTGDVWIYNTQTGGCDGHFKITQLGKALER